VKLRVEIPHFRAMCRDGQPWAITMEGLEGFRAAWMSGSPFWSGIDVWGQPLDVKLADIVAVVVMTEESIALGVEEEEEKKRREVISA
jgi:hypothetical protein